MDEIWSIGYAAELAYDGVTAAQVTGAAGS